MIIVAKKKKDYLTTGFERFSYGLYFVGQHIYFMVMTMFLVVFFMDVGIPATIVATIILVVRLWESISDPILGSFIDNRKAKKGKFLSFLRISLIAIPLATILIFAIPSTIPLWIKVIWATVGYFLLDLSYSLCDIPIWGIVTTMTDKVAERTSLMSIGRVFGLAGILLISVAVPMARMALGGWLPTVVILSIVAIITMLPACFVVKERIEPVRNEKKIGFKEIISYIC